MNLKVAMLTTVHRHDDVRIFHKEAMALLASGRRIDIINPYYEGGDASGIHFSRLPLPEHRLGRVMWGRKQALRAVAQSRAHVCHLHDPELLPLVPRLGRMGVLTVYDAHEDLPRSLISRRWVLPPLRPAAVSGARALLRRYAPQADGIVAATETIAKTIPGAVLVRNRVTDADCARFDEAAQRTPTEPRTVCYAGSITMQRGIQSMIRACAAAGARLLLAGEYESQELRRRMESLPEYSCVEYLGSLDRDGVARLYARASAGLLLLAPTRAYQESEPIKLFEYLCAGLPVAASDFPHWRELAGESEVEWVPSTGWEEAAKAIERLIVGPAPRRRAVERILAQRARFGFGPEANRLLALYDGLEARCR